MTDLSWVLPETMKHKLAELFANFIIQHPDVTTGELVTFSQAFFQIVREDMVGPTPPSEPGRVLEFGPNKVQYIVFTRKELETLGFIANPHLYIGDGQLFCVPCKTRTRHYAMSRGDMHTEVCSKCNQSVRR